MRCQQKMHKGRFHLMELFRFPARGTLAKSFSVGSGRFSFPGGWSLWAPAMASKSGQASGRAREELFLLDSFRFRGWEESFFEKMSKIGLDHCLLDSFFLSRWMPVVQRLNWEIFIGESFASVSQPHHCGHLTVILAQWSWTVPASIDLRVLFSWNTVANVARGIFDEVFSVRIDEADWGWFTLRSSRLMRSFMLLECVVSCPDLSTHGRGNIFKGPLLSLCRVLCPPVTRLLLLRWKFGCGRNKVEGKHACLVQKEWFNRQVVLILCSLCWLVTTLDDLCDTTVTSMVIPFSSIFTALWLEPISRSFAFDKKSTSHMLLTLQAEGTLDSLALCRDFWLNGRLPENPWLLCPQVSSRRAERSLTANQPNEVEKMPQFCLSTCNGSSNRNRF